MRLAGLVPGNGFHRLSRLLYSYRAALQVTNNQINLKGEQL
jgi:hypothetical protein